LDADNRVKSSLCKISIQHNTQKNIEDMGAWNGMMVTIKHCGKNERVVLDFIIINNGSWL
jgi:hypothetical protein